MDVVVDVVVDANVSTEAYDLPIFGGQMVIANLPVHVHVDVHVDVQDGEWAIRSEGRVSR